MSTAVVESPKRGRPRKFDGECYVQSVKLDRELREKMEMIRHTRRLPSLSEAIRQVLGECPKPTVRH